MGWAKKLAAAGVLLVGAKLALAGGAGEALAGMVNEALGGRMVSASIDLELGPRAAEETAPASAAAAAGPWACPACGGQNSGKFCEYCGTPRPQ